MHDPLGSETDRAQVCPGLGLSDGEIKARNPRVRNSVRGSRILAFDLGAESARHTMNGLQISPPTVGGIICARARISLRSTATCRRRRGVHNFRRQFSSANQQRSSHNTNARSGTGTHPEDVDERMELVVTWRVAHERLRSVGQERYHLPQTKPKRGNIRHTSFRRALEKGMLVGSTDFFLEVFLCSFFCCGGGWWKLTANAA